MGKWVNWAVMGTVLSLAVSGPAQAGMIPPAGVPGPAIGLGIPALALLGYAYKRLRDRHED